jgi:hypothetical protein
MRFYQLPLLFPFLCYYLFSIWEIGLRHVLFIDLFIFGYELYSGFSPGSAIGDISVKIDGSAMACCVPIVIHVCWYL